MQKELIIAIALLTAGAQLPAIGQPGPAPAYALLTGTAAVRPLGASYASDALLQPTTVKVRPFITDDARVVGHRLAQVETWFRGDKEAAQQWLMLAYGPTSRVELSLGGVLGLKSRKATGRFPTVCPCSRANT